MGEGKRGRGMCTERGPFQPCEIVVSHRVSVVGMIFIVSSPPFLHTPSISHCLPHSLLFPPACPLTLCLYLFMQEIRQPSWGELREIRCHWRTLITNQDWLLDSHSLRTFLASLPKLECNTPTPTPTPTITTHTNALHHSKPKKICRWSLWGLAKPDFGAHTGAKMKTEAGALRVSQPLSLWPFKGTVRNSLFIFLPRRWSWQDWSHFVWLLWILQGLFSTADVFYI